MIGRTIGGYRIVEQVGMGGMATVYKAYDASTDRYVALKTLPEQYSKDPQFVERFRREAIAIAKLEHLHILPLFAYGEDQGVAYLAMRYLPAGTLSNLIRQKGQMPLEEISRILNQIASALDHAHSNGVLHRDIKPSNVLVDKDNNVYLTDFGIARMVEGTVDLTGDAILGTPQYMSPEQCQGRKDLTPASDQYSLGVMLYEMVTGRVPFTAETPLAVIIMQINGTDLPPPTMMRPDLPEAAQAVILKSLSRDPADRYPSCEAMARAFAQGIQQPRVATQPNIAGAKPLVVTPIHPSQSTVDDGPTMVQNAPPTPPSIPPLRGSTPPPPPPSRTPWIIGAVIAVIAVIAALVLLAPKSTPPPQVAALASATVKPTDVPTDVVVPTVAPSSTAVSALVIVTQTSAPTTAPSATSIPPTSTTAPSATNVPPTATTVPSATSTHTSTPTTAPSATSTHTSTPTTAPSATPTTVPPTATSTSTSTPTTAPTATSVPPTATTTAPTAVALANNGLPAVVSTLIAQGDTGAAISLLDPAIEQTPKDASLYLLRAQAYISNSDADSAIQNLTQAITIQPDFADAYVTRAQVYANNGNSDNALADLAQAVKLQPNRADIYALQGKIYRDTSDLEKSMAAYDKAVELDPQNPQWHIDRAVTKEYKGDLDGAIADYTQAITLDPQSYSAYVQRGYDLRQQEKYDLALADFVKARAINGQDVSSYEGLLGLFVDVQDRGGSLPDYDLDKALDDANQALQVQSSDAALWYLRGRIYGFRNEREAAISDFTQAIDLDSNYGDAYVARGFQYTNGSQWDEAHADFNKALELNADNLDALQGRVEAYLEAVDNDKGWSGYTLNDALADAEKAVQEDSGNAVSYLLRGKVYGRMGQFDKGLADLNQTIQIEPSMAWGYLERGAIYYGAKKLAPAINDFKKAISLEPNDAWSYVQLGDALYDNGQKKEALAAYQNYARLTTDAGDTVVDYVQQRITELGG